MHGATVGAAPTQHERSRKRVTLLQPKMKRRICVHCVSACNTPGQIDIVNTILARVVPVIGQGGTGPAHSVSQTEKAIAKTKIHRMKSLSKAPIIFQPVKKHHCKFHYKFRLNVSYLFRCQTLLYYQSVYCRQPIALGTSRA